MVLLSCLSVALLIGLAFGVHTWFRLILFASCIWFLLGMLAGAYVKVIFPPKIKQYYSADLSLRFGRKR